jgi:glycosyltransferase involved in cell wall biosynthesis
MKKIGLSLIIPVYNSAEWIGPTLTHIFKALDGTRFDVEIIIVDDGSTDDSVAAVKVIKSPKKVKLTIIEQQNSGRYLARKRGVEAARYEHILFIDSRVYIDEGSLRYLERELKTTSDQIWNGHVNIDKRGNIFARFWDAIVVIAWRKYFKKPTRTSYGIDSFDHYPKGTGFFFVPKKRLQDAMVFFEQSTNDLRHSSDDTLLIRYLAERQDINLSPEFSCLYHGRSTFKQFIKHAYSRGQFFIDGFLRKGTRFFYPLLAVLATSLVGIILLLAFAPVSFIYLIVAAILFSILLTVGAVILGVTPKDSLSLGVLSVPFAIVYLLGLWRGIFRKLRNQGVKGNALNVKRGLMKKRAVLNGALLEYFLVSVIYALITVVIMGLIPIVGLSSTIFTAGPGDATAGFVWLNFIDRSPDLSLSSTNFVNYPIGENPGSPIYITYLILWAPIRLLSYLFDPIAAINIVTMFGFVTTALAAYWFVKRLTGSILASFFAGYALAFFPYAIAKGTAHLAYVYNVFFVFLVATFIALWVKPTAKRGFAFGLVLASCFYFDGYFILLSTVMVLGLVIAGILQGIFYKFKLKDFLDRLKVLIISLVTFIVLALPVAITSVTEMSAVDDTLSSSRSSIDVEIPFYRSWPIDFLIPAEDNPLFESIDGYAALQEFRNTRSDKLSNTSFVGYTNIILIVVGFILLATHLFRKRVKSRNASTLSLIDARTRFKFSLLGLITIVCSALFIGFMLSPAVTVLGVTILMPGAVFTELDLSLWRNMSRFSGPLQVVIVLFAAFTLWVLTASLKRQVNGRSRLAVLLPIIAIISLVPTYLNNVNFPSYDITKQSQTYYWLKEQDDIEVIARLPVVDPIDEYSSNYSTTQLVHEKKMVNAKDPRYRIISNTLGSIENTETLSWSYLRGADALVVRLDECIEVNNLRLVFDDSESGFCTYKFIQGVSYDSNFVVFKSGVDPTPNYDVAQKNTARLNSDVVRMLVTGPDLDTRSSGMVRMSAKIYNWNSAAPITGVWKLVQDNVVISSGRVGEKYSDIYAQVDASKEVVLKIERQNGGNDLLIQDMLVEKL